MDEVIKFMICGAKFKAIKESLELAKIKLQNLEETRESEMKKFNEESGKVSKMHLELRMKEEYLKLQEQVRNIDLKGVVIFQFDTVESDIKESDVYKKMAGLTHEKREAWLEKGNEIIGKILAKSKERMEKIIAWIELQNSLQRKSENLTKLKLATYNYNQDHPSCLTIKDLEMFKEILEKKTKTISKDWKLKIKGILLKENSYLEVMLKKWKQLEDSKEDEFSRKEVQGIGLNKVRKYYPKRTKFTVRKRG
jgi:hypothetical protein